MNREIKFRVWNEDLKKMAHFDDAHILTDSPSTELRWSLYGWKSNKPYNEPCYTNDLDTYEPVVMQYTGLKDKNGVEIYEGDIIGTWEGEELGWEAYRVDWWEENARYFLCNLDDKYMGEADFCDDPFEWHKLEVIGNIYENPELLEKHDTN